MKCRYARYALEFETKVKSKIASLAVNYEERKAVDAQLKTAKGEAKNKLEEKSKDCTAG